MNAGGKRGRRPAGPHLALVGDLFLGGQAADAGSVVTIDVPSFRSASLRIANLESPISDAAARANKAVLSTSPAARDTLREMRIDAVSLANNHVHDLGLRGIVDTLQNLGAVGVRHAGAGRGEAEAGRPVRIADGLYLLAYCHHDRPTLNDVLIAGPGVAGVAPLDKSSILRELDGLPLSARAIIYLHWGEEHLWLPSPEQLAIARRLLAHPRTAVVVGAHAHRPQGYLVHEGKRAYFCLGNFLMPNFVILPPAIAAPDTSSHAVTQETYRYHRVSRPTLKRWRRVNRLSLLVRLEPESGRTSHEVLLQDDSAPVVRRPSGAVRRLVAAWLGLLGLTYHLPSPAYGALYAANRFVTRTSWNASVRLWRAREQGPIWVARKVAERLGGRAVAKRDGGGRD